jgi:hypothetical protein
MGGYVLDFSEIDQTQVALVGGKGAHLGELARIAGLRMPAGFCVTTAAYRRILAAVPPLDAQLDQLSRLQADNRDAIRALSAAVRRTLEAIALPADLATAITGALARLGADAAVAVRSSATAEDAPTASFADQHDTYLNVVGAEVVLGHIRRCWASLFTERAVTYRLDAAVRGDQGPGDAGGGPDDPWRGDRSGVRRPGGRGGRAGHAADPGRATDPRTWNAGVRRDPALAGWSTLDGFVEKPDSVLVSCGIPVQHP